MVVLWLEIHLLSSSYKFMNSSRCIDGMREVFHSGTKKLFALINRSLKTKMGWMRKVFRNWQLIIKDWGEEKPKKKKKKKKRRRRRRSGYAYEAKMNEGTKMFVGCNSIRAKHGKIQEALVEARLTSEEFRLCSHHCTHWYQGKDVQLGESKPCCCWLTNLHFLQQQGMAFNFIVFPKPILKCLLIMIIPL